MCKDYLAGRCNRGADCKVSVEVLADEVDPCLRSQNNLGSASSMLEADVPETHARTSVSCSG